MYVPSQKISLLHDLIEAIHNTTLNENEIQAIAKKTCSILNAHFFALLLFFETKDSAPRLISNNPPEFYPAYNEVYKEDFITEAVVVTGRTCVLRRIPGWADKKNQNFLSTLAKVRPASDGIYVPIKTADGAMRGVWAIARAEVDSPPFSNNEIEVFDFLAKFLSSAYARSSLLSVMETDVALLDHHGHVLQAGNRIREVFREVFGLGAGSPGSEKKRNLQYFYAQYGKFLRSPYQVKIDHVTVFAHRRPFTFIFSLCPNGILTASRAEIPCAAVTCIKPEGEQPPLDPSAQEQKTSYRFTTREREVLAGIFKGMSNKEIAYCMEVDESTVKRHTHNIYEKTGFRSRVELVLNLPVKATGINFS